MLGNIFEIHFYDSIQVVQSCLCDVSFDCILFFVFNATLAGKIGKGGRNTRAAANAAKSKLTPVTPVAPSAPTEIVFESGGMTPACTRVQNLFEDIIDKFPHTVPPLSSRQVLTFKPPDSVCVAHKKKCCWLFD